MYQGSGLGEHAVVCARGVFIFVRNFSRGIFLRKSLSKVSATAAAATLDSDFLRKIPRARARARNRARNPTHLTAAKRSWLVHRQPTRCIP